MRVRGCSDNDLNADLRLKLIMAFDRGVVRPLLISRKSMGGRESITQGESRLDTLQLAVSIVMMYVYSEPW
jgi:hypothetical protein